MIWAVLTLKAMRKFEEDANIILVFLWFSLTAIRIYFMGLWYFTHFLWHSRVYTEKLGEKYLGNEMGHNQKTVLMGRRKKNGLHGTACENGPHGTS